MSCSRPFFPIDNISRGKTYPPPGVVSLMNNAGTDAENNARGFQRAAILFDTFAPPSLPFRLALWLNQHTSHGAGCWWGSTHTLLPYLSLFRQGSNRVFIFPEDWPEYISALSAPYFVKIWLLRMMTYTKKKKKKDRQTWLRFCWLMILGSSKERDAGRNERENCGKSVRRIAALMKSLSAL